MNKLIYTVKQLNGELRSLLETSYSSIWVEGEISGLAKPASGHLYFSLKDENSIIGCAFFRNRQNRNTPEPREGMQVLLNGQISYYEPRGNLQFLVTYMEEAGEGVLRRAFEALKQKLASEGLFDQKYKKALPQYPRTIGIITSDNGAALNDILVTLGRRYSLGKIVIYPTLVQGSDAPKNIVDAIELADKRQETEVIILARGGGSLEDLQAFNDESVARSVFDCTIPVISGVGHEIDFTICDFVADQRAPTPTAAAELVAPNVQYIRRSLLSLQTEITQRTLKKLQNFQQGLDISTSRLVHPSQKLAIFCSELRYLNKQLINLYQSYIQYLQNSLEYNRNLISANSPAINIQYQGQKIRALRYALNSHVGIQMQSLTHSLTQFYGKIQVMSPEHTLNRGYAIVKNSDDRVISSTNQISEGQALQVKVSKGNFGVTVDEI